ncbi:MAG: HD domain-containing protein [Bacteroidetes bacterium]|nr:HD domain-containing protein [Bacteroidota bacterium]
MIFNQDKYNKAWKFAAIAHQKVNQTVPGTDLPYILHVGSVAMEVIAALSIEQLDNPDLAVQCALLHDVIEDTEATYDDVLDSFGKDVADGVNALSKDDKLPDKPARMKDSLKRIKEQPKEVWMVKMADRITNLQPPPAHWNEDKINNYREEARLIYDELKEGSECLAERLFQKINKY